MITSLNRVLSREFKAIFANKRLMVILILIPILFTVFCGFVYMEKSIKNIKVGVINNSPSQLSRSVIEGFRKSERFEVTNFLTSENEVTPLMEKGEIDAVLIIPADFTRDIKSGKTADIFVGANGANMTISNTTMTGALEIIGTISAGIAIKKYEASGQLAEQAYQSAMPISFSIRSWYNPTNNYMNFLVLGYPLIMVQMVTFLYVAVAIAGERKNGTIAELVGNAKNAVPLILGKIIPYFLCSFLSLFLSVLILNKGFYIPMRGSFSTLLILSFAFLFCICSIGIFISIVVKNTLDATQYCMLVALPSFLLSGFTWPIQAMPDFCKILAHLFPLTYICMSLRDIALLGVGFDIIKQNVYILSIVGLVFLILSFIAFQWVFMRGNLVEE